MAATILFTLCQFSIIACGLVAGVFLTFSDFVMKSLAATHPAGGIQSMQVINRKVFKTIFMVLLLGMSALSPFLISYAYFDLTGLVSHLIIAGGVLFLIGVFGVSLVFNVPMNQHLDAMDYTATDTATYWMETYVPRWSFWNYMRAIASAGSAICYLAACILLVQAV